MLWIWDGRLRDGRKNKINTETTTNRYICTHLYPVCPSCNHSLSVSLSVSLSLSLCLSLSLSLCHAITLSLSLSLSLSCNHSLSLCLSPSTHCLGVWQSMCLPVTTKSTSLYCTLGRCILSYKKVSGGGREIKGREGGREKEIRDKLFIAYYQILTS